MRKTVSSGPSSIPSGEEEGGEKGGGEEEVRENLLFLCRGPHSPPHGGRFSSSSPQGEKIVVEVVSKDQKYNSSCH